MDAYPVPKELITSQGSFEKAVELALTLCQYKNDKQAADAIEMDTGNFSLCKSGQRPWSVEKVCRIMETGQNLIPLAWLAHRYGHGLVLLETEAERRERALREELEKERFKNRVLVEALNGRTA